MLPYVILAILTAVTLAVLLFPLRAHKRMALAVGAVFAIGAFSLYFVLGSPQILPLLAQRQQKLAELKNIIIERSQEIKANPNNLQAWIEFGDSFMQAEQFSAAANAFKHAVILSQGNPVLILAYARAQIFAADGNVTNDAKKALEMVILQDQDNPEARYFLAVRQFQDGHTEQAMQSMKSLYHSLPENSPVRRMMDRQIGRGMSQGMPLQTP